MPNYDSFLAVVRCIRLWAKRRGLYSNKMGFFGGINCNLLVCFVCQLYPQARPCGGSPPSNPNPYPNPNPNPNPNPDLLHELLERAVQVSAALLERSIHLG